MFTPVRGDAEPLAEQFAVTPQTIRKDLNELCDKRLLTRVTADGISSPATTVYAGEPAHAVCTPDTSPLVV